MPLILVYTLLSGTANKLLLVFWGPANHLALLSTN